MEIFLLLKNTNGLHLKKNYLAFLFLYVLHSEYYSVACMESKTKKFDNSLGKPNIGRERVKNIKKNHNTIFLSKYGFKTPKNIIIINYFALFKTLHSDCLLTAGPPPS